MDCEPILKKIKSFLDDLLEESDYQQVCSHLKQCPRCQTYAASIGSLSYRLHTLGNVAPPPDMLSTLLYALKKQAPPASPAPALEEAAPAPASHQSLWMLLLAVFFISVGAITFIFFWHKGPVASSTVLVPAAPVKTQPAVVSQEVPPPLQHWHYHLTASSREELLELMGQLGLVAYFQTTDLVVINVPRENVGEFTTRLAALNGVLQEFGDMNISSVNEDSILVSIYLD